ncbi:MAG: hypothetical protein QOF72_3171, partial [Blastocatellia bacterium]|nr:hypothetical protein [Blastocatellia bacterium]
MGARFDIEHINFIGYLTDDNSRPAPRCQEATLCEFLASFADPREIKKRTISDDPAWQDNLQVTAKALTKKLKPHSRKVLSEEKVEKILLELKKYFSDYDAYVLLLPKVAREDQLKKLYEQFVHEAKIDIL